MCMSCAACEFDVVVHVWPETKFPESPVPSNSKTYFKLFSGIPYHFRHIPYLRVSRSLGCARATHTEPLYGARRRPQPSELQRKAGLAGSNLIWATVNIMDSRAMPRMDIGFFIGSVLWAPLNRLVYRIHVVLACQ